MIRITHTILILIIKLMKIQKHSYQMEMTKSKRFAQKIQKAIRSRCDLKVQKNLFHLN